ncbi:MAG: SAM-dependent methyltransferase [Clostridium sp.]|uniref:SAM-dependent methyltransferase n=1 Tax=Clostridium TaxID=1485 RepID=UPI0021526D7B|nr:SAM-dependent methyltransferase [Clostridium sp. LY3-2]MCR6514094.1 SAM-dependent methyltransferase [Clostridium sp. LY3-2]
MTEEFCENILNIKTSGIQQIDDKFYHYNRYEPTDYRALDLLFSNYDLLETDSIVDFGSGKGRLMFYINYEFNSKVTGIEMNFNYIRESLENKESYLKKYKKKEDKITFLNILAEDYEVSKEDTKFYFFNPFSIQIFMKVIDNILDSVDDYYRKIDIVLYYPSDDYIYYLENNTAFTLKKEIDVSKLYKHYDSREKFLIYTLSY